MNPSISSKIPSRQPQRIVLGNGRKAPSPMRAHLSGQVDTFGVVANSGASDNLLAPPRPSAPSPLNPLQKAVTALAQHCLEIETGVEPLEGVVLAYLEKQGKRLSDVADQQDISNDLRSDLANVVLRQRALSALYFVRQFGQNLDADLWQNICTVEGLYLRATTPPKGTAKRAPSHSERETIKEVLNTVAQALTDPELLKAGTGCALGPWHQKISEWADTL